MTRVYIILRNFSDTFDRKGQKKKRASTREFFIK